MIGQNVGTLRQDLFIYLFGGGWVGKQTAPVFKRQDRHQQIEGVCTVFRCEHTHTCRRHWKKQDWVEPHRPSQKKGKFLMQCTSATKAACFRRKLCVFLRRQGGNRSLDSCRTCRFLHAAASHNLCFWRIQLPSDNELLRFSYRRMSPFFGRGTGRRLTVAQNWQNTLTLSCLWGYDRPLLVAQSPGEGVFSLIASCC